MRKLVYLGSASKGNRRSLWETANLISGEGFVVFAPCLGWYGEEDRRTRPRIMNSCFDVLRRCEVFVALYEGIQTVGLWQEYDRCEQSNLPRCIFTYDRRMGESLSFPVIAGVEGLKEWLHGLQKDSRNTKS